MIDGTPAMTWTLPIEKPGAFDTEFSIRVPPSGNPRHAEPRLVELVLRDALEEQRHRPRIDVDRHAEGLGDGIRRDVVVGRADAARGEDVVVAGAERVERGDDVVLDVGDDPDLAEIDADIGQVLGDIADVLVLGPAGENLVADHQDRRRDDLSRAFARLGHGFPGSPCFRAAAGRPRRHDSGPRAFALAQSAPRRNRLHSKPMP